tara:strand:- start:9169 stop:10764 length:1596 start_codon:yes stop_codon:yes gene_type:complete
MESKSLYSQLVDSVNPPPPQSSTVVPIPTKLKNNNDLVKRFFSSRGVDLANLEGLPEMTTGRKYFNNVGEVDAIGFLYGDEAIKWRAIDHKAFTQDGVARTFYNIENVDPSAEEIIICEGEADTVALASIGVNSVSVPNGAPKNVSNKRIDPSEDAKFHYVYEARDILESKEKIIICADRDEAGDALAEEIARRVGRAKCWKLKIPEKCNDVTDLLTESGEDAVLDAIENAEPFPLSGVYSASDYESELAEIYEKGVGSGFSTGIDSLDELFTIAEGQLSVITGLPSSGKSEFVDQLMMNLAVNHSWKFAIASFENPPKIHIAKLLEKYIGKPFYEGNRARMTRTEVAEGMKFINEHFCFIENKDGSMPTVQMLLDKVKQSVLRLGCRGLVIDPYNMLDMDTEREHVAISKMLSEITSYCKSSSIHCFFVAHPAKMRARDDGTYPVVGGQHVSSSSAWHAKADLGITVHRGDMGVEIHCWKCRFKWIGSQGMKRLAYDVPTGRYYDVPPLEKDESLPSSISAKPHWMDDWD